ncbi:hypothetical protein PENSUB_6097 [Penicillium subrubescens]|uniref:Uncharacterized protein n=1 Tax=Penicillium subrubescens TaxID=1316194 RepID=A0A1Q5U3V2_9EURO|nr:hypothetical protein PENSUB_6097 [Penicillium subrubescens]
MVQASEDKGPSETDHILADALRLLHFLDDEEHFRNLQPEERKLICISVLDEYSEEYDSLGILD